MAAANSRWFLFQNGTQAGPVSWGELQALAQSGRLRPNDPVLREGGQTWQAAQTARDVDDGTPPAMVPVPPVAITLGRPRMATAIDADDDVADAAGGSGSMNVCRMLFGILLCGGGILGTIIGYNAALARGGGKYIIFTGPIIYGLILIFRSFGGTRKAT